MLHCSLSLGLSMPKKRVRKPVVRAAVSDDADAAQKALPATEKLNYYHRGGELPSTVSGTTCAAGDGSIK